jgi:predicted nucleic acid-binding protein
MRAVLDACVLYPTVLREVLMAAAARGLFTPLWSARLLEEWARAAAKLGPRQEAVARGEIALLRARWPRSEVPAAPQLETRLWLPDPDDIHVLASAVAGSADTIVTFNAADFPRNALADEGIARTDPDALMLSLHARDPARVAEAAEEVRATAERLSAEPWEIRRLLKKAGLPRLGKALSAAPSS